MIKQTGGLLLPYKNASEAATIFKDFIANSDPIYVSNGASGIVYKYNLKNPITKNYSYITPNQNYGSNVNSILLKLCIISNQDMSVKFLNDGDSAIQLTSVTLEDFQNEINIQTEVYLKTLDYLQPICPGIVYADILNLNSDTFIAIKSNVNGKQGKAFQNIFSKLKLYNNPNIKIGIVAMEFMKDSVTLHNTEMNEEQLNICRFSLLELASKTGYNHNDFHRGNMMIENNMNYFKGKTNRAVIIDFGRAQKIPIDALNKIKEEIAKKAYLNALKLLCSVDSGTPETVYDPRYNTYYGWVCGDYNTHDSSYFDKLTNVLKIEFGNNIPETKKQIRQQHKTNLCDSSDAKIDELYRLREEAIDDNIKIMDQLHGSDPKYPLLPISNSIKNNLYNGMIGGSKRNKKTKKIKKRIKTSRRKHNKSKRLRKL